MTTAHTAPKSLRPDASGFVRLDRGTCFERILSTLHEETPTKASVLHARLPFSEQAIRDSLTTLTAHGFVERVRPGFYIRRWAPIPGVA
jgi:hypothetical protein